MKQSEIWVITGGRLRLLKFEMLRVQCANMKCAMSAHFIKNVNKHVCLCVSTFHSNACAFLPVRVKACYVKQNASILNFFYAYSHILKTSLSHAHTYTHDW